MSQSSPLASSVTDGAEAHRTSNFLRAIIERDLGSESFTHRHHAGTPGDAAHHAAGPLDVARIRTRFPPEPNGYLHVGHAKSICLNFGLARDYAGACHLRFDDTNPEKEDQEYVDAIIDAVQWLGFSWGEQLYYASDYFDAMYRAAEHLILGGHAYVDEQSAEQIRASRGTLTEAGTPSPFRDRSVTENLARFREMRDGQHVDGAMVLRAKIDMASPNINLRDPAIYRIRHATHHNTGDRWCIYPMYTFAHPIEDALEGITHSICTLEFEDQRPFYDWLLARLSESVHAESGTDRLPALLAEPLPHQYEFARLNLTYVVTSKRKLRALVDLGHVSGWDDPRMPTLVGLRRRGYTPEAIRLFCDRIGVSKSDSWIDYSTLDIALRDDLEGKAPRGMAVLDPVELQLDNWDEIYGSAHRERCSAPMHPQHAEWGQREFLLGPRLWIERDDFMEIPVKGYHRLYPGNKVRLKYGLVIHCTGCDKDDTGRVVRVRAQIVPDTRSGTPGADAIKVKGVITWVGADDGVAAEIRLYDRLYREAQPEAGGRDHLEALNPDSLRVAQGWVEPAFARLEAARSVQFERHGYFVTDRLDHNRDPGADRVVFNRTTTLKDGWAK